MKKMSVYLAVSLDGFIATTEGSVGWLDDVNGEGDNGYERYYSEIDAVVMGRNTYSTILNFGVPFPYKDKDCYVYTNQLTGLDENVTFINGTVADLIDKLTKLDYQKIWVSGGGQLISALLNQNCVDELIVTVAPVLLGTGIPLFTGIEKFHKLKLVHTKQYGQFVELKYSV